MCFALHVWVDTLPAQLEGLYSADAQDKELNKKFTRIEERFERLESTKAGEPLVGSPFDNRLNRVAEDLSTAKSAAAALKSTVDQNIFFSRILFTALFGIYGVGLWLLFDLRSTLTHIQDSIPSVAIQNAISGELDAAKLKRIQEIVTKAKGSGNNIDPKVVNQVGTRILREKESRPKLQDLAWQTAIQLIEYRSTLNADSAPLPPQPAHPPYYKYFPYNSITLAALPPGKNALQMSVLYYGQASPENAALFDSLKNPPPAGLTSEAELIIVDGGGGGISLDGYRVKNVVIKNAQVFYGGGPLTLENVYFVNCTFKIVKDPNSERLGEQILASTAVSFKTPA